MIRTMVLYGNCQVEQLVRYLRQIPGLTNAPIFYYASVERLPAFKVPDAPDEAIAACTLFCGHPDDARRPFPRHLLPADCERITFPALAFNVLWPWREANPYAAPDGRFPWGVFPYGDRVINACVEAGLGPDEILAYYLTAAWEEHRPNLDRLLEVEHRRLSVLDAKSDLKLGEVVLANFTEHNLFWSVNHPAGTLVKDLIARVLTSCAAAVPVLRDIDLPAFFAEVPIDPFVAMGVPVHPKVAEYFGLRWYDPNRRYQWQDGRTYTYAEYFEALIGRAIAVRGATASSENRPADIRQ